MIRFQPTNYPTHPSLCHLSHKECSNIQFHLRGIIFFFFFIGNLRGIIYLTQVICCLQIYNQIINCKSLPYAWQLAHNQTFTAPLTCPPFLSQKSNQIDASDHWGFHSFELLGKRGAVLRSTIWAKTHWWHHRSPY